MKRTNRFLLLICGAAMPLFAGCGGCGSRSAAHQQAMRGDWGADDEEPTPPPLRELPADADAEAPSPVVAPAAESAPAETIPPETTPVQPLPAQPIVAVAEDALPSAAPQASVAASPPLETAPESESTATAELSESPVAESATPIPADVQQAEAPSQEAAASNLSAEQEELVVETAVNSVVSKPLREESVVPGDTTGTLLPKARELAVAGKETEADRMLLGEALLRDRLEEWPFEMQWSPALKRPTPWIRTGVAFYVTATDVRGDMAPIPAKDRALERDFGPIGGDVLNLGGELAEKSLAAHLTLLRAGALGPTLAPLAGGPVDAGRALPTRLCGGLVLFGPGEQRLVKAHAERLGLDLLIVYEVRAKRNVEDASQPINDTSLKVIDVVGDRELFETKSLRNIEVAATRKNPVALDPVDLIMREVEQFLDAQMPLTDFPIEVRPDNVRARLPKVIDQALASKNALPYLVEIKALHLHGYLAGLEARDAYVAILGESGGNALYSGTPEERLDALERLLPSL